MTIPRHGERGRIPGPAAALRLLLLVAFLAWTVMKPRQGSQPAPAAGAAPGAAPGEDSSYGFGAGAR